jgi:hypothetical protein
LTSRWIVDRTPKPLHERRFSCGHTRWLSRGKRQQGKTPNPDGVRGSVDIAGEKTESIFCDAEVVLPPSSSCSPDSTCANLNEMALVTVASLDHLCYFPCDCRDNDEKESILLPSLNNWIATSEGKL